MTPADPRDGLPELPERDCYWHGNDLFTADQMRAYGQQCIAHARPDEALEIVSKLAKLRDGLDNSNSSAEELAAQLAHRAAALTPDQSP